MLDESLRATEQQKEAAEQVSAAMVQIRTAAEQLAGEQQQRAGDRRAGRTRSSTSSSTDLAGLAATAPRRRDGGNGAAEPMSGVHVRVRVAGEHYALPVEDVLEVAELRAITPVPGAPPAVLGVRNLRGQVLPVRRPGGACSGSVARVAGADRRRRGRRAPGRAGGRLGRSRSSPAAGLEPADSPHLRGGAGRRRAGRRGRPGVVLDAAEAGPAA